MTALSSAVVLASTATDVAAVVVAVCSVLAVVLLVVAVTATTRTLTAIRLSVEQVRREALPVIDDLGRTVRQANDDLARVEPLLDSAANVTATVDSASHLAYLAVSNPVIKAVALATGTAKAAKAFRRRG